jgi:hypothetical protein
VVNVCGILDVSICCIESPLGGTAFDEWAKQRMLNAVLAPPPPSSKDLAEVAGKIETTQEELDGFETVRKLLGPERNVAYEDSAAYFKIHLAEKRTWVCARLQLNRKNPLVWVPLPPDQVAPLVRGRPIIACGVWTQVSLESASHLTELGDLLRAAYASVRQARTSDE